MYNGNYFLVSSAVLFIYALHRGKKMCEYLAFCQGQPCFSFTFTFYYAPRMLGEDFDLRLCLEVHHFKKSALKQNCLTLKQLYRTQ